MSGIISIGSLATTIGEDEFDGFDFDSVDGRAKAVRHLLGLFDFTKDDDPNWMSHIVSGYNALNHAGLYPMGMRRMTDEELELFHAGTYRADTDAPALTSFITILHPMYSTFDASLGTDQYYRMAVGAWYFDPDLSSAERGAMIIHEIMHGVLGHHKIRAIDRTLGNMAGDIVINQQIERSGLTLPKDPNGEDFLCFPRTVRTQRHPNGMDEHLDFWDYYNALAEEAKKGGDGGSGSDSSDDGRNGSPSEAGPSGQGQGKGQGQGQGDGGKSGKGRKPSQGHAGRTGNGQEPSQGQGDSGQPGNVQGGGAGDVSACHEVTADETDAFNANGVEPATEVEEEMARQDSLLKAMEESRKSRGTTGSFLNSFILNALRPSRVDWRKLLSIIVSRSYGSIIAGHTDISYRKPNRRRSDNSDGIIFPGSVSYSPQVIVGCDTSGSMSEDDYEAALGEVDGILRKGNLPRIRFVTVDTEITGDSVVSDPKKLKLNGGGGTIMKVFYDFVNGMKTDRPDMTVLMTDGGIDWDDCLSTMDRRRTNLILVTDKYGYDRYRSDYGNANVRGLQVIPIYKER